MCSLNFGRFLFASPLRPLRSASSAVEGAKSRTPCSNSVVVSCERGKSTATSSCSKLELTNCKCSSSYLAVPVHVHEVKECFRVLLG